ncbi:hypothetical protein Ahy_A06g030318 isoform C [Arachis hypogaea]|uniref:Uncharacterized protein n=1 Tax=Arachis hypogaea TaxID=3818 RepID=A0A445CVW4_ARAHY|nr:hypothetical protein Ahy_A06g030318 isoform C [Arachis hypogaea]
MLEFSPWFGRAKATHNNKGQKRHFLSVYESTRTFIAAFIILSFPFSNNKKEKKEKEKKSIKFNNCTWQRRTSTTEHRERKRLLKASQRSQRTTQHSVRAFPILCHHSSVLQFKKTVHGFGHFDSIVQSW